MTDERLSQRAATIGKIKVLRNWAVPGMRIFLTGSVIVGFLSNATLLFAHHPPVQRIGPAGIPFWQFGWTWRTRVARMALLDLHSQGRKPHERFYTLCPRMAWHCASLDL